MRKSKVKSQKSKVKSQKSKVKRLIRSEKYLSSLSSLSSLSPLSSLSLLFADKIELLDVYDGDYLNFAN